MLLLDSNSALKWPLCYFSWFQGFGYFRVLKRFQGYKLVYGFKIFGCFVRGFPGFQVFRGFR